MFNIGDMLKQDLAYFDSFTSKKVTDYGILYHNALNPMSWDSNHAVIYDFKDPGAAIQDIIRFYRERNLTPRVYQAYINNELDILRPHLESHGFTAKIQPSIFMLFSNANSSPQPVTADVREIRELTQDLIDLIHTEDTGDWSINVLKYHFKDTNFHLFGVFDHGKVVSQASLKFMNGYTCVNDVLTHKEYRGRHFGTELLKTLVNFHQAASTNYLYLWSENPIAIKMYQNVGFQTIDIHKVCWTAWMDTGVKST